MKKKYFAPNVEVIKIETTGMLAVSGQLDDTTEITDPNVFGAPAFNFDVQF